MHPRLAAHRSSRRPVVLVAAALLGACASPGDAWRGRPDQATFARLAAAEKAWRAEAPEYPALREELAASPVAAAWLTRMFVNEVIRAREGGSAPAYEEVRVAARFNEPDALDKGLRAAVQDPSKRVADLSYLTGSAGKQEKRAITEIVELGSGAVPVLIDELLFNDQVHLRQFGVELTGYVGRPAVPALLAAADSANVRDRRAVALALARLPLDEEALARLLQFARDPEFTVRADAARGLQHGGAKAGEALRAMVRADADAFVRRTAVQALLGHPSRRTAECLADYLERCQRDVDTRGYEATQATLIELAGARGPRTVAAWRHWIASLPSDS